MSGWCPRSPSARRTPRSWPASAWPRRSPHWPPSGAATCSAPDTRRSDYGGRGVGPAPAACRVRRPPRRRPGLQAPDAQDVGHVAARAGGGVVLALALLAGDHVGGVPVPPVVRCVALLVRVVVLGGFLQQRRTERDVRGAA